ncbi:MAG: hypothetical protein H6510_02735 [Acidobacteria bacterium]|nr:hypothetical protein [Acidobacteriota bacterium]MCB9396712.1 hypothetical protein [Acidobacteriota bacterium]
MEKKEQTELQILGVEELESRMEMAFVGVVDVDVNNKCTVNTVAGCGVK